MKKVDMHRRKLLMGTGKGFLGVILTALFAGSLSAFEKKTAVQPKIVKKVIVKKTTAVWG